MEARIGPFPGPAGARGDAGFTLIELMIAVTILSLLTLTVSLGANRPRSEAARDWERFGTVHDLLREQAVLSQRVLGLALTPEGYQRMHRDGGTWIAEGDPVDWRGQVSVEAPIAPPAPVWFLPSGRTVALRVRFEASGTVRVCESDGWNAVSCSAR
jgi:type II secretion system protein H